MLEATTHYPLNPTPPRINIILILILLLVGWMGSSNPGDALAENSHEQTLKEPSNTLERNQKNSAEKENSTATLAENSVEQTLKEGSDALRRNALTEADQFFTTASTATKANRIQRATAFAGRCAVRYKISLSNKEPAMLPQAITDCDRALELKSDMQQAYRIRGIALLSAGHPERAAEDLNIAVALNPEDFLAFQNRALALAKLGRAKEAMAELDAAIRLKPEHPWSYYNRGRMHLTQGDYTQAIDDFIAFIRFKRNHEEVYRLRGQSRLMIGLPQQAVGDFYESLRLHPNNNPNAYFLRGQAFFLLDRFIEAEQDLTTANQLQPNNIENRLWLYIVRARLGKPDPTILTKPTIQLNSNSWPDALIDIFLDKAPPETGLTAARQIDDPIEQQLRENLTLLLLGHWAQSKNQPTQATQWLSAIKKGEEKERPYYRTAQQEIRHIAASNSAETLPYPPQSFRAALPAETTNQQAATTEATSTANANPPETNPKPTPTDNKSVKATAPTPLSTDQTSPIPDLRGKFVFKVASYTNAQNARNALVRYANMGMPVFIEPGTYENKLYHRIWIGPFDDLTSANAAREQIRVLPNQNPRKVTQR